MPPSRAPSHDLSFLSLFRIVLVGLSLIVAWQIQDILLYCFLAILLAGVIYPFTNWGLRYRIPKIVSVLVIYIGLFSLLALIVTLLVPALVGQSQALVETYGASLGNWAKGVRDSRLLEQLGIVPGGGEAPTVSNIQGQIQSLVTNAFSVVSSIFGGIAGFVVVLVLALYVVIEDSAIKKLFHHWVPKAYQEFSTRLVWLVMQKLGAWMRGQLMLCLIIGVLSLIAYALLGVPYALLLAVIAGLFEFVPYIGPILAGIPAALIAFTVSPALGLATLGAMIIIQQLENNLIVPKVMQKTVGLNPIVSILAFLIGAKLFGIVGAIVSIPVAIAIQVALSEWSEFSRSRE